MKKEDILVLGDSHSRIFRRRYLKLLLFRRRFFVYSVLGATISGIENPNSKTQSRNVFSSAIEKYKNEVDKCIVLIGEVDTGFVLWYKHEHEGTSIDELLELAVSKYTRFLKDIQRSGMQVIVISTPLPTIKDDCIWGEVANLRKDIKANQVVRTELTLKFNNIMSQICKQNSFKYLSIDNISINKEKGVVKKVFRSFSKNDHHYNDIVYSLALYLKLRRAL